MTKLIDPLLRLHQIIGDKKSTPPIDPIIPVSKSTWLRGVASGRFPKPIKLGVGGRAIFWRKSELCILMRTEATPEHSENA